jgi:hypothetical protein
MLTHTPQTSTWSQPGWSSSSVFASLRSRKHCTVFVCCCGRFCFLLFKVVCGWWQAGYSGVRKGVQKTKVKVRKGSRYVPFRCFLSQSAVEETLYCFCLLLWQIFLFCLKLFVDDGKQDIQTGSRERCTENESESALGSRSIHSI